MAVTLFKDSIVLSLNENALLIIWLSKSKFILMSQIISLFVFSAKAPVEQLLSIIIPPGRIMEYQKRYVSYYFMIKWRDPKLTATMDLSLFIAGI